MSLLQKLHHKLSILKRWNVAMLFLAVICSLALFKLNNINSEIEPKTRRVINKKQFTEKFVIALDLDNNIRCYNSSTSKLVWKLNVHADGTKGVFDKSAKYFIENKKLGESMNSFSPLLLKLEQELQGKGIVFKKKDREVETHQEDVKIDLYKGVELMNSQLDLYKKSSDGPIFSLTKKVIFSFFPGKNRRDINTLYELDIPDNNEILNTNTLSNTLYTFLKSSTEPIRKLAIVNSNGIVEEVINLLEPTKFSMKKILEKIRKESQYLNTLENNQPNIMEPSYDNFFYSTFQLSRFLKEVASFQKNQLLMMKDSEQINEDFIFYDIIQYNKISILLIVFLLFAIGIILYLAVTMHKKREFLLKEITKEQARNFKRALRLSPKKRKIGKRTKKKDLIEFQGITITEDIDEDKSSSSQSKRNSQSNFTLNPCDDIMLKDSIKQTDGLVIDRVNLNQEEIVLDFLSSDNCDSKSKLESESLGDSLEGIEVKKEANQLVPYTYTNQKDFAHLNSQEAFEIGQTTAIESIEYKYYFDYDQKVKKLIKKEFVKIKTSHHDPNNEILLKIYNDLCHNNIAIEDCNITYHDNAITMFNLNLANLDLRKIDKELLFKSIKSINFKISKLVKSPEDVARWDKQNKEQMLMLGEGNPFIRYDRFLRRVYNEDKLSITTLSAEILGTNKLKPNNTTLNDTFDDGRLVKYFEDPVKIGEGGFGSVFLVKNNFDLNKYAIKIIRLSMEDGKNLQDQSVVKEVRTMTRMNHKNVVRYYDCWFEKKNEFNMCCKNSKDINRSHKNQDICNYFSRTPVTNEKRPVTSDYVKKDLSTLTSWPAADISSKSIESKKSNTESLKSSKLKLKKSLKNSRKSSINDSITISQEGFSISKNSIVNFVVSPKKDIKIEKNVVNLNLWEDSKESNASENKDFIANNDFSKSKMSIKKQGLDLWGSDKEFDSKENSTDMIKCNENLKNDEMLSEISSSHTNRKLKNTAMIDTNKSLLSNLMSTVVNKKKSRKISFDEESKTESIYNDEFNGYQSLRNRRRNKTINRKPKEEVYFLMQMEYCNGTSLKEFIENRTVKSTGKEIYNYFSQIVSGVEHIHENKTIHRDLKPGNIFLSTNGSLKIGDFGLAASHDFPSKTKTFSYNSNGDSNKQIEFTGRNSFRLNENVGTPLYQSPEQLENRFYNEKVDSYAIGLILLELCSTFNTLSEKVFCFNAIRKQHTLPQEMRDDFPIESEIVLMLTEKDLKKRPTVKELIKSEQYLELKYRYGNSK